MDGTNPFFVILEDTIRAEVEAKGDKLISTDPANDVSLQITQIEDMITQGIDAIFLNPAEAEGILPALDMLKEAGIPIINFDTEVADLSYVNAYVGSDNYNAGYVCGLDLVAKRPQGGPIIINRGLFLFDMDLLQHRKAPRYIAWRFSCCILFI